MKTMTSREFNQDTAGAKRAAEHGPVFITNRGRRAWVLLSNTEYERITGQPRSLLDALAMPGMEDIDIDFEAVLPRRTGSPRAAEFD